MKSNLQNEKVFEKLLENEHKNIVKLNPIADFLAFLPSSCLSSFDKTTGLCPERTTKNFEIALFMYDGGYCVIDGEKFDIHKGDLRFLRPGQIIYSKKMGDFYSIHFSLSCDNATLQTALALTRDIPTFMPSFDINLYTSLFKDMISAQAGSSIQHIFLLKMRIFDLLNHIFETASKYNNSAKLSDKSISVIEKTIDFLEKNYCNDIGLAEISKNVGLHPVYFNRLFSKTTGNSPIAYLKHLRLTKSKELLLGTNLKVVEIAKKCGFSTSAYYIVQFKKEYGCTPAQLRAKNNDRYFTLIQRAKQTQTKIYIIKKVYLYAFLF